MEEVSNSDGSIKVASGQSRFASATEEEIPLLPLVAKRAIRFPASFEAWVWRKVCIGVAMLPYQMG